MAVTKVKKPTDLVTEAELQSKITQILKLAINIAHPIGSYFISANGADPSEYLGGVWERVEGKFIFASDMKNPAGYIGGSDTHRLTSSEMPIHSHAPGSLSLKGAFKAFATDRVKSPDLSTTVSGCFSCQEDFTRGTDASFDRGERSGNRIYNFDTTGQWHGETDIAGGSTPFSIMPPFVSANIWRRVK